MHAPVVVITGASAGVGRATARAFAERGARIGLTARNPNGLEAARKEVESLGGEAIVVEGDLADPATTEEVAERTEEAFGPLDVWVNNAMNSVFSRVVDLEPEEVRRVTEVTYLGTVFGTLAALKRMTRRDRGTIVQVGSALAYRSIPLQASYCAAKAAVRGFTDSLRTELIHDDSNVKLTHVHLPALNTPQFSHVKTRLPNQPQPVPPIYTPEVAAGAIVWAAEHPRREYLVGHPTVGAVWGQKLVPGLLDRYLARGGIEDQQTDDPLPAEHEHNLWAPPGHDEGAAGMFGDRSRERSLHWEFTKRRRKLGLMAAGAAVAAVVRTARNGR